MNTPKYLDSLAKFVENLGIFCVFAWMEIFFEKID